MKPQLTIFVFISALVFMFSSPALSQDPNGEDTLFIDCTPPDYYAAESMKVSFDLRFKTDNNGPGNDITSLGIPLLITITNNTKAKARIDTSTTRVFSGTAVQGWDIKKVTVSSNGGSPTFFPMEFTLGAVNFSSTNLFGPATYILAHLNFVVKDTCTININVGLGETPLCLSTLSSGCYSPRFIKNGCPVSATDCVAKAGDANEDGALDMNDLIFLSNFLFKLGPAPMPLCRGDYNGDRLVSFSDVFYAINHFFKLGPAPKGSGACCL